MTIGSSGSRIAGYSRSLSDTLSTKVTCPSIGRTRRWPWASRIHWGELQMSKMSRSASRSAPTVRPRSSTSTRTTAKPSNCPGRNTGACPLRPPSEGSARRQWRSVSCVIPTTCRTWLGVYLIGPLRFVVHNKIACLCARHQRFHWMWCDPIAAIVRILLRHWPSGRSEECCLAEILGAGWRVRGDHAYSAIIARVV